MKTNITNKTMEGNACKIFKAMSYVICLACFFANSVAIFRAFCSNTTIISTQVIPSPDGVLESPTFLICNDSPYKKPILYFDADGFKNNTMALEDTLVDVLFVKAEEGGFLSYKPVSIKESVKEIATMFYGTCFMIDKQLQVNQTLSVFVSVRKKSSLPTN